MNNVLNELKVGFIALIALTAACGGGGTGASDQGPQPTTVVQPTPALQPSTPAPSPAPTPTPAPIPLSITTQPQSREVKAGDSVSFSIAVIGNGPFLYQWRRNGSDIAGADQSSIAFANVSVIDSAIFSVVVTDSKGSSVISDSAQLTVIEPVPNKKWTINKLGLDASSLKVGNDYKAYKAMMVPGIAWMQHSNRDTVGGVDYSDTNGWVERAVLNGFPRVSFPAQYVRAGARCNE